VVPAGWLVMGVPAKPVRKMSQDELDDILRNAVEYLDLWHRDYRGQVLHSDISGSDPGS
jgi:carbonic anhydrase/acetyltransferase-like protein (isoleucine patch superfamily)